MDTISDFKRNIPTGEDVNEMLEFYGIDSDKTFQCPACTEMGAVMRVMITHLNDSGYLQTPIGVMVKNHDWTFKQIGKWLEKLGY